MGCFFGCLRVRDGRSRRPHLVSSSSTSKSTERPVSRNQLSSLFLDEEKGDYPSNDLRSPQVGEDIKDEAKFLKACGTIPETPGEIRKASQKFEQSTPCGGDSETSNFRSGLPNTSIDKFQLDKQSDQPPTPIKLFEALGRSSDSPENTPTSCISNAAKTESFTMVSTGSSEETTVDKTVKIDILSTSASGRNKAVRFDCEPDASSARSENGGQNRNKLEVLGYKSASKPSPNPTPLKLSEEMQTPGTVFHSNLEALANGKTQIRSQYVHSVLNPVDNASHLNAMKEEPFSSKDMFSELKESPERPEKATPHLSVGVKQTSLMKGSEDQGSLSSWLKPKQYTIDDRIKNLQATSSKSRTLADRPIIGMVAAHWNEDESSCLKPRQCTIDDRIKNLQANSSKTPHCGRTLADRPIIGMVAAHWNEDESSHISPKWWDGNGIPNSTNKYKEDQKVSWHATPFEERLEKALSEESLISQSKYVNQTPMAFDETDESDTALSQLRPPSHSKSVVSF